jgi:ADP-ribose pyrophosphatase YjhB (NUDIX family)
MGTFSESYLGRLREVIGSRLVLMPGCRIVIENRAGELLLEQRSDFGVWGLAGGVPEPGESIETAIIREVAEETGLRVRDVRPFGYASDPAHETWTYPNGHQCQYFSLMFYTHAFSGELAALDGESLQLGWFAPDRLPEMLPNMRRAVEAYMRFRASGEFQMI